mgnify:CR=1 FL=1
MNGAKFLKTNIFCNKCNCGFETLLVAIWGCVTYDFADRTGLTQRKEGAELRFSTSFGLPKIILLFEPHLFDQGLGFGLVSPEIHIERHRMFVTALRENLTAESLRTSGLKIPFSLNSEKASAQVPRPTCNRNNRQHIRRQKCG